jgi:3-oxoacyl-[acyl-carrier protein] reductase
MDLNIQGKTALVCGASQGIGKACCQELALLGANVIALSRQKGRLQEVVACLDTTKGQQHDLIAVDVGDRLQLKQQVESHLERTSIEILINNTAGPKPGPIKDAKEQTFLQGIENHLLVNRLLVELTLPGMKKHQFGRIINITSTSVKIPIPGLGVSNTVRAAVASWAKTLSLEVASDGITVNTVLPGFTKTPRLDSLIETKAKAGQTSFDVVAQNMKHSVPVGRFAKAQEIAAACAFLASPAASYINGVALAVDGGRTGCL